MPDLQANFGLLLKLSAGEPVNSEMKALAEKQRKLLEFGKEMCDVRKRMDKYTNPSEYDSDLTKRLKKLKNPFVKDSELDGDHDKNIKMLEAILKNQDAQENIMLTQSQQLIEQMQYLRQEMSAAEKRVEDTQEKLLATKKELCDLRELMDEYTETSEYDSDLIRRLRKAGINYSERDGVHQKIIVGIDQELKALVPLEKKLEAESQKLTRDMQKVSDTISTQVDQMHKALEEHYEHLKTIRP